MASLPKTLACLLLLLTLLLACTSSSSSAAVVMGKQRMMTKMRSLDRRSNGDGGVNRTFGNHRHRSLSRRISAGLVGERGVVADDTAALLPPAASLLPTTTAADDALGLNVQDFGCMPDGSRCGPQMQKAVETAMSSGRALIVPAGNYNINQTINVPINLVGGTLRIRGEGKYLSTFSAVDAPPESPIFAVFNITWVSVTKESTHVEFSDFSVNAAGIAEYGIYAPGQTRSYYNRLNIVSALKSGIYHGGWIDVFNQCSFNGNKYAGLELGLDSNNVVVDSCSFEGGNGYGILINGGQQISIINNVIEGNTKEGIFANAVSGLAIRSNYFEWNQIGHGPVAKPFGVGTNRAGNLTYYADIVLNGNAQGGPTAALGAAAANWGVELVGNTFCPHGPQRKHDAIVVAFLLAAVESGTMNSNKIICLNDQTSLFLVSTLEFFHIRDLKIYGNAGATTPIYQSNFPAGFYLHHHNVSYTQPHLDFEYDPLPAQFTNPIMKMNLESEAVTNVIPLTSSGADLVFNWNSTISREQYQDSVNITMEPTTSSSGIESKIFGTRFPPIVNTRLNKLPVKFTIPVRCYSSSTVVSLVFFPGYGAPAQYSSDWYFPISDEWQDVTIAGELNVPALPPGTSIGVEDGPAVGIQISQDSANTLTNLAVGKQGYLLPLGARSPAGL